MTNPAALLALEGKLVEAKEGSRELDAMFGTVLLDWPVVYSCEIRPQPLDNRGNYLPLWTSSIDAALALVSRCLPEHGYSLSDYKGAEPMVFLHPPNDGSLVHVYAATIPLAICLCLVRSLKGAGE